MRLFLKILALLGAIITSLGTLTIVPATIRYLIKPPGELVAMTPFILRILLLGLAGFAGVEAILLGLLAHLEVKLRRERVVLAIVFGGLALASLVLIRCLKLSLF